MWGHRDGAAIANILSFLSGFCPISFCFEVGAIFGQRSSLLVSSYLPKIKKFNKLCLNFVVVSFFPESDYYSFTLASIIT
jgi:hypothetical protein